jgi:hypothetical protein
MLEVGKDGGRRGGLSPRRDVGIGRKGGGGGVLT